MKNLNVADLLKNALAAQAPTVKAAEPIAARLSPAQQTLAAHGISAAWDVYSLPADAPVVAQYEETTIRDIVARLVRWGSISPAQVRFVAGLLDRIEKRAARMAERKAQRALAADIPTGRMEFTGTVVSSKLVHSDFGTVTKVLLQHADGWQVYGTLPRAIEQVAKGDTLTLTATIERSKDDPKFGFYARPTGARATRATEAAA